MLNITNQQGFANQNHNEISSHTCQKDYYQKDNKLQAHKHTHTQTHTQNEIVLSHKKRMKYYHWQQLSWT